MRFEGDGHFPSTQWTLIARLKSDDSDTSRRALNDLCTQYHYPLYCYIRRRGLEHHDAQDALHEFLAKLVRLEAFQGADEEKGRLRSFLAASLQRFLITWKVGQASKREVSVDAEAALAKSESRYLKEQFTDEDTPDRVFDRKWAQTLLQHVLKRLGETYADRGKDPLFKALKPVLLRGGSLRGEDSATLAESLGMKEGALRTALNRLLKDYRDLLEKEVRQTVAESAEVQEELACLRQLFGNK